MGTKSKVSVCVGAVVVAAGLGTVIAFAASTDPERVQYIEPLAHTTMQDFNSDDCASMPMYTTLELTDERNNQKYRVRKMPDNRCWMIDNLEIADTTITSTNSNISDASYTIPAIGTRGTADDTPYVDDPALNSTNKNNCLYNMGTSPDSLTGCGYLYSWSAATAGTGNGLSSGNATGSICPAGWHLPTGTSSGEFAVLNGSMINGAPSTAATTDTYASRANWWSTGPFSGSYAGNFNGSTWSGQGRYGFWWSSTADRATHAYYAGVRNDYLHPGANNDTQYYGMSVRCLL